MYNENDLIVEEIDLNSDLEILPELDNEEDIVHYYLFIQNDKINGRGLCQILDSDVINFEVTEEIYNDFEKYMYSDGDIVLNPDFEKEQEAKEKARIAELSLTRADVFEGLILARGLTKQALRAYIELDETLNDIEKALYLNRFDDALEFYRKHPAIDFISAKLGISADDMDKFFDTKDYNYLKPVIEVE